MAKEETRAVRAKAPTSGACNLDTTLYDEPERSGSSESGRSHSCERPLSQPGRPPLVHARQIVTGGRRPQQRAHLLLHRQAPPLRSFRRFLLPCRRAADARPAAADDLVCAATGRRCGRPELIVRRRLRRGGPPSPRQQVGVEAGELVGEPAQRRGRCGAPRKAEPRRLSLLRQRRRRRCCGGAGVRGLAIGVVGWLLRR